MTQNRPERRARTVALVGLGFEVLLTAFLLLLSLWGASASLRALTLLSGVGILIWFFLVLIYQQKVLVREEEFESEQLRKERETGLSGGTIFNVEEEELLLAKRRLRWMFRWLLPAFTILIVGGLLLSGWVSWPWGFRETLDSNQWPPTQNSGMLIWFVGGIAFFSFLLSRTAVGMARLPGCQMLRAGASWLMGVTLVAVAVAATLAALHFAETPVPERILAKVVRGLLLVLAAEITLNFVLDFYRPRGPEEEPRPAFESRLFGLFSEPGGLARSIADAINYQFGFEVSSTWFYKLLQRSMVPLVGFAVAVLFLASCLVFVDVNEQALIERFGVPLKDRGILGPGMHVKAPWPIDVARKVATAQVHELKIGIEVPDDPNQVKKEELILWTNKHSQEPHLEVLVATPKLADFIRESVATRPAGAAATQPGDELAATGPGETKEAAQKGDPAAARTSQAVAVSLMRVAVSLQYKINDALDWLSTYDHPEAMLQAIAEREINRYCASVDVQGLIGGQRAQVEKALQKAIQERAESANLGVQIVFLGLQGVHPPESTAQDFQDVVGAEQKKAAAIRSADAEYNKTLSEMAGSMAQAKALASQIQLVNRLDASGQETPELAAARARLNALFMGNAEEGIPPAGGRVAQIREHAKAERWRQENEARAREDTFEQEMQAKNAAPEVYRARKLLEAVISAGDSLRKYIVASDGVLQLNLQDPMTANIQSALEQQNP